MTDDEVNTISDWRRKQLDLASSAETIRRLIRIGLEVEGGASKKK